MAQADLFKQLFRVYRDSDGESFIEVARTIGEEERKKYRSTVARLHATHGFWQSKEADCQRDPIQPKICHG